MFNLKVYAMKKQRFFEELRLKVCVTLAVCMALLLNAPSLGAQNSTIKVKGVVNDAMGPVIGASIVEKGNTGNGTITDIDGNFSLNVSSNSTLIVSFVGYKAQEIPVAGKTFFTIDLKEDNEMLEEVVVVGFATQKKVNLTGSVGTATAKDIEARPVANAVQALQGVIPGLNISNSGNGGELNATKSIDVRGTGTVGKDASGNAFSSGSPLILIDGMEGDLNSINPQDIESISVLKDAAASSIYGSRAPFGVVLVTTKSGKSGRAQINYNMNMRYSTPIKMPDMANSYEFVNLFDDAEYNGSGKHLYTDEYRQFVYDFMTGKSDDYIWGNGSGGKWNYDYSANNVNWLKEYYRNTAPSQEHNVSVSGGSDKMTYYLSANYMTQEGFMRYGTEDYDRYTITAKISAQLTKALKVDYSNRWVRTDYERPTYMNDDFYNHILRRARPVRAVYDPNGYLMSDINYIGVMRDGGRHNEQKDAMAQQLKITVTPLKNWNIIGEMNIKTDNNWNHWEQFVVYSHYKDNPENTYTALTSANKDQVSEYSLKTTYLNPTVYSNYNFSLKEKHNFTVLGGFQAEIMKYRDMEGARTGLVTTDLPVLNLTTDADSYTLKGLYKNWKNAGFFGRINYDYNGKYLVEGNLRYDGSSRFRRGNRWILTPSFSLGWNVARENFWEKLADVVEVFKLRVSYGELANQNTTSWYPTYQTLGVTTNGGKWLQNGALTSVASVPGLISTSLSWEKIKNTNIGFDFGALNNRLTGSFDYFWRKTKNMVGPGVELPAILGATVPSTNNTDLTTFGWELSIGWRDKVGELGYGVKLNISDNQTRIDKYPNPTNSLSKYMAGELTGDIYGYTTIGIAKTQEEMDAHIASLPKGRQTAIGSKWEAGDIMYADINGDGKIDNGSNTLDDMGDLKKIGNNTPRFRTGITLDAQWKGFDFSMFWQGVLKRDFDPGENSMVFWGTTGSGQWWSTSFKDHMDYFRAEDTASPLGANVNAYYPRPLFNNKNHKTQTAYLQNVAYMRLKNLQLGYTLPKSLINKIGLQNVRVYTAMENLFTITDYKGYTPDLGMVDADGAGTSGGSGVMTRGCDDGRYPMARTITFGLQVNF